MRKFYTFLVALLAVCGVAKAQTIEFVAGTDKYSTDQAGAHSLTKDGVTIAVSNGTLGRTDNYRVYKNQTLTVSSTVGDIVSIELVCVASNPASNFDTVDGLVVDGNNGVWTGSAASVEFKASANQVRMTKIVVAIKNADPNFVAAPKITPATGTYYSAQEVTITTTDADAAIHYTLDGSAPTAASTTYAAPFTVSETTTVKAVAVKGDNVSEVAESVITIEALQTQNIASVLTAGVGAASVNATVVAAGQSGFLLGDETGNIYVYTGAAPEVAVGDVVAVSGNTSEYGGRLQFAQPSVQKTGTTEVTYPAPTVLDGAAFDALVSNITVQYVQVAGTVSSVGNYTNFKITGATNTGSLLAPAEVLSQLKVDDPITVTGYFVYVTGSSTKYGTIIATKVDMPEVEYTQFSNFAAAKTAAPASDADAVNAQLNLTEALVTFVNGQSVYLYDGKDGMLVYGTNSKSLKAGDKVSGTVKGKLYRRYGNAQVASPVYDVTVVSSDNAVEPQVVAAADLLANGGEYENELVRINYLGVAEGAAWDNRNVSFDAYADETFETTVGIIAVRDNWSVATSIVFNDETPYTVTGLVALYTKDETTTVQIYPRTIADIDNGEEPVVYEFEGDGTLEKPYTVADIQHKEATSTKEALESDVWVKAYIVGYINGSSVNANTAVFSANAPEGTDKDGNPLTVTVSNVIVADAATADNVAAVIPVALVNKSVARTDLNLGDNADKLGTQVWLKGDIYKYMGVPGLKEVKEYSLDGVNIVDAIEGVAAEAAPAEKAIYTVAGQRVERIVKGGLYIVNGQKVVIR